MAVKTPKPLPAPEVKAERTTPDSATTQAKFSDARAALNAAMVEREEEIDLVLTALLCRENPLLVGPPGTGKSLLGDGLLSWLAPGSRGFTILFNKFSVPEEVFGPVSLKGLKEDRYVRVTSGKLPEAHVAFLDEIFKASSAILNTTLRILNERLYDDGAGGLAPVPLQIAIAASNEWPDDGNGGKELCALLDRFLFRKKVKPVTAAGRRVLLGRAVAGDPCRPAFSGRISPEEVAQAQADAASFTLTDKAKKDLWRILEELAKEGINPGDRRIYKCVAAARAYAYLCGSPNDTVRTEHLEVLKHVLWDDPTEQPEKAARIIMKVANPTGAAVTDLLIQAEDVVLSAKPTEAVPKLQKVQEELTKLPDDPRRDKAIRYVAGLLKTAYNSVIGVKEE
jgi:MoxR-like ATPase